MQKSEPVDVSWKSFSLLIKNGSDMNKDYVEKFTATRDMLRIVEFARSKYGNRIVDRLYTEFGIKVHHESDFSDLAIKQVLKKVCSLDFDEMCNSKDNSELDKVINESMDSAFEVVGRDVGVPIIVFDNTNKKLGYFGPVLSKSPVGEEATRLWHGIKNLAEYEHFFELKRTRDEGASLPEKNW